MNEDNFNDKEAQLKLCFSRKDIDKQTIHALEQVSICCAIDAQHYDPELGC